PQHLGIGGGAWLGVVVEQGGKFTPTRYHLLQTLLQLHLLSSPSAPLSPLRDSLPASLSRRKRRRSKRSRSVRSSGFSAAARSSSEGSCRRRASRRRVAASASPGFSASTSWRIRSA